MECHIPTPGQKYFPDVVVTEKNTRKEICDKGQKSSSLYIYISENCFLVVSWTLPSPFQWQQWHASLPECDVVSCRSSPMISHFSQLYHSTSFVMAISYEVLKKLVYDITFNTDCEIFACIITTAEEVRCTISILARKVRDITKAIVINV